MILSIVASLFSAALVTQVSSQEISLTIEIRETKLDKEVLVAECNSRLIQVVTDTATQGFVVEIEEDLDGNLKVAITDLDGETSLRELQRSATAARDGTQLEREIALIIESVIRRWERKQVNQEAEPEVPAARPTAEPERRAATSAVPMEIQTAERGFSRLFQDSVLDIVFLGGIGLGADQSGLRPSPSLSLSARYGGRLSFGLGLTFFAADAETTIPLTIPKSDFSEWSLRLETAYQVLDTLTGLKLVGMLGLGDQRLRSSEGFEADGLSSMATLGTEYRVNLLQFSRQRLDLALGIYADWTWIGPTFTWTTGEPIYEMSRLRGRMHIGLAWQWR